jgi:hypothetical protein
VAHGNPVGAKVRRGAVQEGVARPACGFLDAQMLRPRVIGDINLADDNRELESGGQCAAELLVAVRGRT